MTHKISICGPREIDLAEIETAKEIANNLAVLIKPDDVIATGGTAGFPTEVLQTIRRHEAPCLFRAYTPCKEDREEWDKFYTKGILSPLELFDEVIYSTIEDDFKARALRRIPDLISGSELILAYVNGCARNTYIEILSAKFLGLPIIALSQSQKIKDSLDYLIGESEKTIIEYDIDNFVFQLNRWAEERRR